MILWNNNVFSENTGKKTAATINDRTYTVTEVNYYYNQFFNNTAQMAQTYAKYGISTGYDTNLGPADQLYSEETGQTYADYFREMARNQLLQLTVLTDQAAEDSYTISEEGKQSVEDQLKEIDAETLKASILYGGSEAYYFSSMFGKDMTKSLLKEMITQEVLATEYAQWRAEQFTYDEAALEAYYQENATDLDSFDYRLCLIPIAEIALETDEAGEELEPTQEQTAAAMETARQSAQEMLARLNAGEDFNTIAMDYVAQEDRESYSDPEYNLTVDSVGSSLTAVYADWLKDDARTAGEYGMVEQDGSGYYVIQLLARERRDDSLQSVDLRSILVMAETTETTNEAGETVAAPTEEQLAVAYAQAEDILAQWDAVSDKNADSFLALAPEAKEKGDSYAETFPEIARNTYGTEFDKWAFTPGTAEVGSTLIVETPNSSGATVGYRIMYLEALGPVRWEYTAENALRNAAYSDWYTALEEQYTVVEEDGMQYVGNWPSDDAGAGADADVDTGDDAGDGAGVGDGTNIDGGDDAGADGQEDDVQE